MGLAEAFAPLFGSWTGVEEVGGTTARAALTVKLDLAGTAVLQDYRQVRADGVERLAHGVFLAGQDGQQVRWWLFDSDGRPPEATTGTWQGSELALTRPTPDGVTAHRFRVHGDRLTYAVDLAGHPGAAPVPLLRGRYARVSGH